MSHSNGEFFWPMGIPCVALAHVPFRCPASSRPMFHLESHFFWRKPKLRVCPAWGLPMSHLDSESFWLMPCIPCVPFSY